MSTAMVPAFAAMAADGMAASLMLAQLQQKVNTHNKGCEIIGQTGK